MTKRIFKGSNKLASAKELFDSRLKYELRAYGSIRGDKLVKRLHFAEMQYYGCVNLKGETMIPNEEKMIFISKNPDGPKTIKLFDFMADMFVDIKTNIEYCKLNNIFNIEIPELSNFTIMKSFVSPIEKYKIHLSNLLLNFNLYFAPLEEEETAITFERYTKTFFKKIIDENLRSKDPTPITLSGWMASAESSIYNTGLGMNVAKDKTGEDQPKINKFISNNSYDYYKKILMNQGFSHAHNAPWNLVVDVASPAMLYYYKKHNIVSVEDMFDKYYIKTKYLDIDILKEIIIKYYNLYVDKSQPKLTFSLQNCPKVGLDNVRKTTWTSQDRFRVSSTEADMVLTDDFWLTCLLYFRNSELGTPYEPGKMDEINDEAIKIHKKLDKLPAIDYINNKMIEFVFKRDFGYIDLIHRESQYHKDIAEFENGIKKLSFDLNNNNY